MKKTLSLTMSDALLLGVVILMYIALCAEADMMTPAFPEMVNYFYTTEDKISLVLSVNFLGLCLASLITGPLSDSFGRRTVLLAGLALFFISCIGCIMADTFNILLAWRLIQGAAASIPMVVGSALFLDKYQLDKASQLVGLLNSFTTAAMAAAPIFGAYLIQHFQWLANFEFIAMIVALSFLGTLFFIPETLSMKDRKPFDFKIISKDYLALLSNHAFVGYCLIALFPFIAVVVYIANLSLIFINHLGISTEAFGYYQATTMGTFVIASALSTRLIGKKGVDFTKNFGGIISLLGIISLIFSAQFAPTSPGWICVSMSLVAAGGAFMVGPFGMKALELNPSMKGASSALMTTLRQLLAASLVFFSEILFDGTIVPVAWLLAIYAATCVLWYGFIYRNSQSRATAVNV